MLQDALAFSRGRQHPNNLIPQYPHTPIPSYPHTLIPSYPDILIPWYPDTLIPSYPNTLISRYLTPGLEIATRSSPMQPKIKHWRLNFQNWLPASDFIKKTTTSLLFLNLYSRKSGIVANIQVTFLFPVKLCLNITRETKKLNLFRHINTLQCAILFQRLLLPVSDWYEQCSCVGAWAKLWICWQQKALRKASRK